MKVSYLRIATCCLMLGLPSFAQQSSRFQSFFSNSQKDFGAISSQTCRASLLAFENAYANSSSKLAIDVGLDGTPNEIYVEGLCRDHASCILNNISQYKTLALATSGIVLGLLPTLLAVLSPSIAELALLSAERPMLAMLTSLGCPGILQTRVFEYIDPGEMLDLPEDLHHRGRRLRLQLVLGPWKKGWTSTLVALVQYVLVIASAVNTQWLAVQLSQKSILSWGCTRAYWPTILWAIFPLFMDGLGALGYRLTLDNRKDTKSRLSAHGIQLMTVAPSRSYSFFTQPDLANSSKDPVITFDSALRPNSSTTDAPETTTKTSFFPRLMGSISREFMPCACHANPIARLNYRRLPSRRVTTGVVLHCIAGFLSFFHLVYGTVTFSGLLFIDTLDAVGEIAMRFLVSGLICRFIMLIEIAGMRGNMLSSRSEGDTLVSRSEESTLIPRAAGHTLTVAR